MKNFFKNKRIISTLLFLFPVLVNADTTLGAGGVAQPHNFKDIICTIAKFALSFIPYLIIIAAGSFLMGLVGYISSGDNEEKRVEGTKLMTYGVIGFFFMVSVWGILNIFTSSFGISVGVPQFKETNGGGCGADVNKPLQ